MTQLITIDVLPPTANKIYGYGKRRVWLDNEVKAFRGKVKRAVEEQGIKSYPADARLQVSIGLCGRDKTKYDVDNRIKATLDALQDAKIIPNDKQVERVMATRLAPAPPNGKCLVLIGALAHSEVLDAQYFP